MPAIIDPSPYYTTLCRGNESQCMADWDGDGVNDRWPLFYDNYFLPRGYAYVLAPDERHGLHDQRLPDARRPRRHRRREVGRRLAQRPREGLQGGRPAPRAEVVADWHNGSSAMIGKSYDGTLSNGVAATGVEGLKTIVPVSAISAWYNYSRTGGVRHNTNYPAEPEPADHLGGTSNPPGVDLPEPPPDLHAGQQRHLQRRQRRHR